MGIMTSPLGTIPLPPVPIPSMPSADSMGTSNGYLPASAAAAGHHHHTNVNSISSSSASASSMTPAPSTAVAETNPGGVAPFQNGFHPASVINLSNSNDIVIGPMTQYQGAVTIYQYMDATGEKISHQGSGGKLGLKGNNNSSPSRDPLHVPKKKCTVFNPENVQTWALIGILVLIVLGVAVAIGLALQKNERQYDGAQHQPPTSEKREILFGNEYEDETIPNLGHGHLVIDRKQWGAAQVTGLQNLTLHHPIGRVIITHVGVQSNPCDTVYNCSIKMRTIQDSAIAEKRIPDLPANFYVSNDGYVYVGRGWNVQNAYAKKSLAICFMGDYVRFVPSERQLDGVKHLLTYALTRDILTRDYQLIGHNQTMSTKSPGTNVYREIIRWRHWIDCGVDDKPKCDWQHDDEDEA